MTEALIGVGLVGAGWMGAFQAESLARRVPGAALIAVADPAAGSAERLAASLDGVRAYLDAAEMLSDADLQAVVIASPAVTSLTTRRNVELFHDAYTAELASFVECVRPDGNPRSPVSRRAPCQVLVHDRIPPWLTHRPRRHP